MARCFINSLHHRVLSNQKGQTAVEYILLIAVMATLITSTLAYIKNKYLGDLTKCANPAFSKTLLCQINEIIEPRQEDKRFQYWPMKK